MQFGIKPILGLFVLKDGPEARAGFVGFLQSPVIMIINLVTLAAVLLHARAWFGLAPRAANIVVRDEEMGLKSIIKSLQAVTVVVIIVILFVILYW